MESPKVKTVLRDSKNGVRYEVMAYRQLTRQELLGAVRYFNSQRKGGKHKRGTIITIMTIIGFDD